MIMCEKCQDWCVLGRGRRRVQGLKAYLLSSRFHVHCLGMTVRKAKTLSSFRCKDCQVLYCHCRQPDDGRPMIGCDSCEEW